MSDLEAPFSLANVDALFKIKFLKYYENTFNSTTPTWSQIEKTNDFVSKRLEFPVPTTYKGGVGSGSLPESHVATYGDVQITSKKVYATDKVDRESIMAALTSEGAFVEAIAECIKKTVEADLWNHSRILYGSADGSLGTIDGGGVVDNGGGNYTLTISAATWKEANWEENMFVNVGAAGVNRFAIETVAPATRAITIQRQAGGADVPAPADVVYLQGSRNNDPEGLDHICDLVGGSAYNVTVARRWQSYQRAVAVGISTPIMNRAAIQLEKQCGKVNDLITTSYTQYEKVLNLLEDQKRYQLTTLEPKAKNLIGKVSFNGVQFMTSQGAVKIFPDRFCPEDRMYFLNSDHIKYYRRPRSGWVKDDIGGNGYLRVAGEDAFEARFATYGQIYICPPFQGVVTGLTT